jgi:hypothetical protein
MDFNRTRIESGVDEWNKLFEETNRRLTAIMTGGLLMRIEKHMLVVNMFGETVSLFQTRYLV